MSELDGDLDDLNGRADNANHSGSNSKCFCHSDDEGGLNYIHKQSNTTIEHDLGASNIAVTFELRIGWTVIFLLYAYHGAILPNDESVWGPEGAFAQNNIPAAQTWRCFGFCRVYLSVLTYGSGTDCLSIS